MGCQAVAQAIVENGLESYYQHRSALPESAQNAVPDALKSLPLYDHPDFQKSFVRPVAEHENEAALILEGITCSACVWLNENHLAKQPGVVGVHINYVTRRAKVRWDARITKLSDILASIAAIGYRAHPFDETRSEQLAQKERRNMLWRVFVAGFGMMQVMMYAFPVYLSHSGDMNAKDQAILHWASLVLTLPVVLYSAAPFFTRALRDIRLKRLGMDIPVALGVGTAFLASVWATITGTGQVYFDSVSMFVFFLLGGRYLEMLARQRARRGVEEVGKILPAFAKRLHTDGRTEDVPVSTLCQGDTVRIKPGQIVPADGVVIEGQSQVDESLLTGESRPIPKTNGDTLTGGTLNQDSPLIAKLTQVGDSTRLAAITRLMDRAAQEKPRLVTQADHIAQYFVIFLLLCAFGCAAVWYFHDPSRMLEMFVAVLVVSCPCALSLATPAALTVGTERLARMGVLVTRGHAIETLAKANVFAFDKTGTLTYGKLKLVHTHIFPPHTEATIFALAAGLEAHSEHPIAKALQAAAQTQNISPSPVQEVRALAGQGLQARFNNKTYTIGRPSYVADVLQQTLPPELAHLQAQNNTLVALASEQEWMAFFLLDDNLRSDAPSLIQHLKPTSQLLILSGDNPAAAQAIGKQLGIEDVRAGLSPEDKRQALLNIQAQAGQVVAMVGDGVNDAPVLAQAHVSIAMGGATDLARNQADIVLLQDKLLTLHEGILYARRITQIVHQNLIWSFIYNAAAIPLAMSGWLTPWMAAIGMSASSLLVILNALRLQTGPHRKDAHD